MDWIEVLVSAAIIALAFFASDGILRAMETTPDSWVDRDSPWLARFERPTKGTK